MNIYVMGQSSILGLAGAADGLFSLAVNNLIPVTTSTMTSSSTKTPQNAGWTFYEGLSSGADVAARGVLIAGNNEAVVNVKPKFFAVATAGAECGALITNLDWADNNLSSYEWMAVGTSSTPAYFVTGVLNSSQTDANDPFNPASGSPFANMVTKAVCWDADYNAGLNPF